MGISLEQWRALPATVRQILADAGAGTPRRTLLVAGAMHLGGVLLVLVAVTACVADRGILGVHVRGVPMPLFEIAASTGGILFFLASILFNTSWMTALPPSEAVSGNTLLYLRPFRFDELFLLQLAVGASTGVLLHLLRGEAYLCLLAFFPLGLRINDEQRLQYAFGAFGRLITFRHPGRTLQPTGALRVAAGEDWQRDVARRMLHARLVIIRPGHSDSMRWEVLQALRTVPPGRLLFYLRFRGSRSRRQRAYDLFRAQVQSFLPVALPGRLPSATYLVIDRQWNPRFFAVGNRPLDLVRQALSGDFERARVRPVLEALGAEGARRPMSLREKLGNLGWQSVWVSVILGFAAGALFAAVTTVYMLFVMLRP